MEVTKPIGFAKTMLFLFCGGLALVALSANATLVTWNLNPNNLNQPVGSSSQVYAVSGYAVSAYGYTTTTVMALCTSCSIKMPAQMSSVWA